MNVNKLLRIGIDRKLVKDYKQVFNNPVGERVLFDLMTRFHVFSNCEDSTQEGQRRAILHIMAILGIDARDLPNLAQKVIEQ